MMTANYTHQQLMLIRFSIIIVIIIISIIFFIIFFGCLNFCFLPLKKKPIF